MSKRKTSYLAVSCLMMLALILGSCAPAPTAEPEPGAPAPGAEMVKNSVGKLAEKPRYGGLLNIALVADLAGFDDGFSHCATCYSTFLTNEELYTGDYSKGSQGTGEAGFMIQGTMFLEYSRPSLATGFELVGEDTVIFHIRQGVHWQDKAPVNGREFDATDIAATFNRNFAEPQAYLFKVFRPEDRPKSITALDKWTLEVVCAPGNRPDTLSRLTDCIQVVAKEVIDQYGGQTDWKNVVGTGPFILQDYVAGSSATLVRNPNYWDVDPLFPKNKSPYLDGVNMLIIPDESTRIAALRTGKVDWVKGVGWEDAASLHKSNPELKAMRFAEAAHQNIIWMRMDKPELPYKDIRVRRALARGLNQKEIMDEYYGGNAVLLSCPVAPYPEFAEIYRDVDEYSEEVQKDYGYYPEEAKQLLAEAGYPDGFKAKILCTARKADLLSIVAAQWAKIGVDLELDVKETSVHRSQSYAGKHEDMVIQHLSSVACYRFLHVRKGNLQNFGMIDDPKVEPVYDVIKANVVMHDDVVRKALYNFWPYEKDQCWYIETPTPIYEIIWQPWIKQYGGEWTVGYSNAYAFPIWVWCDQELKKSMGK